MRAARGWAARGEREVRCAFHFLIPAFQNLRDRGSGVTIIERTNVIGRAQLRAPV